MSGCAAQRDLIRIGHSHKFRVGWYTLANGYVVERVYDPNFCFAVNYNTNPPSVIAVSVSDKDGVKYNGQKLKGPYVMIDTYTYEFEGKRNTIPLVVSINDYQDICHVERELEAAEGKDSRD